jgi:DNA-binding Lrp family transcriptional regulator
LVSDSAINQQLEKLEARGVIPKEVIYREPLPLAANVTPIHADVVDAIRWYDQKDEELRALKTQDVSNQHAAWLDVLIENFIAFGPNPSDAPEATQKILSQLQVEVKDLLENGSYGPDAKDYMHKVLRELEVIIDKL